MPKFSIDCDCNAIAKMPEATIILLLPWKQDFQVGYIFPFMKKVIKLAYI